MLLTKKVNIEPCYANFSSLQSFTHVFNKAKSVYDCPLTVIHFMTIRLKHVFCGNHMPHVIVNAGCSFKLPFGL